MNRSALANMTKGLLDGSAAGNGIAGVWAMTFKGAP